MIKNFFVQTTATQQGPPPTMVTSKKVTLLRRRSAPMATVSAGTETDPEHFKSEAKVHFMQSPTTVVFAQPTTPRKQVTFTSAWGRSVKLMDLYEGGIVDEKTKNALEVKKCLNNVLKIWIYMS